MTPVTVFMIKFYLVYNLQWLICFPLHRQQPINICLFVRHVCHELFHIMFSIKLMILFSLNFLCVFFVLPQLASMCIVSVYF